MVFETTFHFCAQNFFDPFPSSAHIILFALIPLSNLLTYLSSRKDMSDHYCFMSLISGMAMGIGLLYTIMFLPLTANSCLLVLLFGFGLLGLAPLLSMPCTWLSGKTVCHLAQGKSTYFNPHQLEHIGHLLVLVMVIAVELPSTLTRINLATATNINHPEIEMTESAPPPQMNWESIKNAALMPPVEFSSITQGPVPLFPPVNKATKDAENAIKWLRQYGNQETLLRACYERSGKATDILGSLWESHHPIKVEDARDVFFRVTGKPFNTVPIPQGARATLKRSGAMEGDTSPNAAVTDEFDYDANIAGESVSGLARGLSLAKSQISGILYKKENVAQLTWQITLNNKSAFDREMRAKILLPPHAVVYKAALLVDGKEYNAEIMARQAARAYYQQAVKEHKDPLMVSTCGLDQILVQCFPIQPGKESTLKIELAAPLFLTENKGGVLTLPSLLERNFLCENNTAVTLNQEQEPAIKMSLPAKELSNLNNTIFASHTGEIQPRTTKEVTRRKLFLLIDGSKEMQGAFPEIAEALASSSANLDLEIAVVQDEPVKLYCGPASGTNQAFVNALDYLRQYKTAGGYDDSTSLEYYLAHAAGISKAQVLWIHGSQPHQSNRLNLIQSHLSNKIYNGSGRSLLWDMPISAGPNELLSGMTSDKAPRLARVPRADQLKEDLKEFLANYLCSNTDDKMKAQFAPYPNFPALRQRQAVVVATDSSYSMPDGYNKLAPTPTPAILKANAQLQTPAQAYNHFQNEAQKLTQKIKVSEQILRLLSKHTAYAEGLACNLANQEHLVSPISSAIVTQEIPHKELNAPPSRPLAINSIKEAFEAILGKILGPSVLMGNSMEKMVATAPPAEMDEIRAQEERCKLDDKEANRKLVIEPRYSDSRQDIEKKGNFRYRSSGNKEQIALAPSYTPMTSKADNSPSISPSASPTPRLEVLPEQASGESQAIGGSTEYPLSPTMQGAANGTIAPQTKNNLLSTQENDGINEIGKLGSERESAKQPTWELKSTYFGRGDSHSQIYQQQKQESKTIADNLRRKGSESTSIGATGSESDSPVAKDKSLLDSFIFGGNGNINNLSAGAGGSDDFKGVNNAGTIRDSEEGNRNSLKEAISSYIPSPFLILGAVILIMLLTLKRQRPKIKK
jgi:hypothetical protein